MIVTRCAKIVAAITTIAFMLCKHKHYQIQNESEYENEYL